MISLIPTFFFLHTYQSFCNGTFLLCTILCSVFILISRNVFLNIFKFVNPLSPRPSICHFTLPPFFYVFGFFLYLEVGINKLITNIFLNKVFLKNEGYFLNLTLCCSFNQITILFNFFYLKKKRINAKFY